MHKKTRQYVLFGATIILGLATWYFYAAAGYMQDALLNERLRAVERDISYICGGVDYLVAADGGVWKYEKYQTMLEHVTTLVDATENVYAELLDANYNRLSERVVSEHNEVSLNFDPRVYDDLMARIKQEESGTMTIPHTIENGEVDVHLYWRWIPTGVQHQNRVLFIAGVTKYSVSMQMASWLTYGIIGLFAIVMVFIVGSIMLVTVEPKRVEAQNT
jgi:hypothetical protein